MQSLLRVENYEIMRGEFHLSIPELIVEKRKITCLMGKSGSGKSTFLLSLAGFVPASKGKLIYEDRDITFLRPEERRLGLVFQKAALFSHLNVIQNVEFGLKVRGDEKGARIQKATEWLEKLQIGHLKEKKSLEISVGEAQRVALARVLAMDYPVILLDEPFSSLDVELRQDLRNEILELITQHGRGALLITHDPADVQTLASHQYTLKNHQVLRGDGG